MKSLLPFLCMFSMLYTSNSIAQDLNIKWSEKIAHSKVRDGLFKYYAGITDKSVYVLYSKKYSTADRPENPDKNLKLIGFDKKNMTQIGQVILNDKKDKPRMAMIKDLEFRNVCVLKEVIYVFWQKIRKDAIDIYAESFNLSLKRISDLKNVYHISSARQKHDLINLTIVKGGKERNSILIGCNITIEDDKNYNCYFNYITLGASGEELKKGEIKLTPIEKSDHNLYSSCFFTSDENIYIKNIAYYYSADKLRNKNKLSASLTILNTTSGESTNHLFKYETVSIKNIDFIEQNDGTVKMYGFFNDLNKDSTGISNQGVFTAAIDNNSRKILNSKFSYFQKESELGTKAEDKVQNEDQRSIEKFFGEEIIERVKIVDGNLFLFCTKLRNASYTSTSTTPGVSTASCKKTDVIVYKINPEGKIVWTSIINRSIAYPEFNICDLALAVKDDKFYVAYGSNYEDLSEIKKPGKVRRNEFQYAIISIETGSAEKHDFTVNQPAIRKADHKFIKPYEIGAADNQFFLSSTHRGTGYLGMIDIDN
jgi:hypothetical protein